MSGLTVWYEVYGYMFHVYKCMNVLTTHMLPDKEYMVCTLSNVEIWLVREGHMTHDSG